MNFKIREFTVEKDGKQVTFQDETIPTTHCIISCKKLQKILKRGVVGAILHLQVNQIEGSNKVELSNNLSIVLDKYKDVFQEPKEPPPTRDCDHSIALEPGCKPVTARPYRLSFHQKTVMEAQIAELLQRRLLDQV